MSKLQLVVNADVGFTDVEFTSTRLVTEECTTVSGKDGRWNSLGHDGCVGEGDYANAEDHAPHIVCKQPHVCMGKWERVFRHDMRAGEMFSTVENTLSFNKDQPDANLISRLDVVQSFMTPDSLFHFMLLYPDLNSQRMEWVQANNPILNKGEEPSGFIPIDAKMKAPTSSECQSEPYGQSLMPLTCNGS